MAAWVTGLALWWIRDGGTAAQGELGSGHEGGTGRHPALPSYWPGHLGLPENSQGCRQEEGGRCGGQVLGTALGSCSGHTGSHFTKHVHPSGIVARLRFRSRVFALELS